jgi:hypothetical protein
MSAKKWRKGAPIFSAIVTIVSYFKFKSCFFRTIQISVLISNSNNDFKAEFAKLGGSVRSSR